MGQFNELSAEIASSRDAIKNEDFDSALVFSPLKLRSSVASPAYPSTILDMTEFAVARRLVNSQDIASFFNLILDRARAGGLSVDCKSRIEELVEQYNRRRRAQEVLSVPKVK